MKILTLCLICLCIHAAAAAQREKQPQGNTRGLLRVETISIPKQVSDDFVRLNSDLLLYHPVKAGEEPSPLVIFLHGSGGSRRAIERAKWSGEVKTFVSPAPGIPSAHVLVPQSKGEWDPGSLDRMLDYVLEENPRIDRNRIYCIGYSMGGKGTWEWAMNSPHRFAAIVPKGFIPNLTKLDQMVSLPIWAMVGSNDTRARSQGIPAMKHALVELGSTVVRTTVFEGANHATAAGKSKQQKGVYEWLFSHRLPRSNASPVRTKSQ